MFDNRKRHGTPFTRTYSQFNAALELENIYVGGRSKKLSDEAIMKNLTAKLEDQISRGIFISNHLIRLALDVSFIGLSENEKTEFATIARRYTKKLLIEDTHFHLEF